MKKTLNQSDVIPN